MARIVVIGGHGKVALRLARVLTERGDELSSVFRNADHAGDVAASGAAIRVINAAARAGVKRFVMVSYFGAGPDHVVPSENSFFPYAEAKAAADAHLRAGDLDWTVLGSGRLTFEPPTGRIVIGKGKREVSRADVALVVAAALHDDSTIGRAIDFNDGADGHGVPIAEALADR